MRWDYVKVHTSCYIKSASMSNSKMIKQLTSNTSYFIVCEATCFGPYVTIIRPSKNQVNKCWLHVGIPTMFTISTSILYLADRYIKFKG